MEVTEDSKTEEKPKKEKLKIHDYRGSFVNPENPEFINALQQENEVIDLLKQVWNMDVIRLPNYAPIDALFYRDMKLVAIGEIKNRKFGLDKLQTEYNSEIMIRLDKLEQGKLLSTMLQVPHLIINCLTESKHLYYWKMTDDRGNSICDYQCRMKRVPTNIEKNRYTFTMNAFLNLSEAKEIVIPKIEPIVEPENQAEEQTELQTNE